MGCSSLSFGHGREEHPPTETHSGSYAKDDCDRLLGIPAPRAMEAPEWIQEIWPGSDMIIPVRFVGTGEGKPFEETRYYVRNKPAHQGKSPAANCSPRTSYS